MSTVQYSFRILSKWSVPSGTDYISESTETVRALRDRFCEHFQVKPQEIELVVRRFITRDDEFSGWISL